MQAVWGLVRRSAPVRRLREALGGGPPPRELQRIADLHRLYLFTQLRQRLLLLQQQEGGGSASGSTGEALRAFSQELQARAAALAPADLEAAVQRDLRAQLVGAARALHDALGEAGDPRPAAAAFERAAAAEAAAAAAQQTAGAGNSSSSSSSKGRGLSALLGDDGGDGGGSTSGGAATAAKLLPQARAAELLRARLGFALAVRPSTVAHADAGHGLFIAGAARPGTLVALFPGLVYAPADHRRMPGYPRVDAGNPYLAALYSRAVVDSLPWGRGWLAPELPATPSKPDEPAAAPYLGRGRGSGSGSGSGPEPPPPPPRKKGRLRRILEAADGPRRAPPPTEWVTPTSYEAGVALELLEGRHPLALAHFANHATRALPPNAAVAPVRFKLARRRRRPAGGGSGGSDGSSGRGKEGSSSGAEGNAQGDDDGVGGVGEIDGDEPAWLRAYVPFAPYAAEPSRAQLLEEEVVGLGLVAIEPLEDGDEVVFNYRLSPGLGRPQWYVPLDGVEEDRRWA